MTAMQGLVGAAKLAVMLTRKDMRDRGPQMNRNWWAGAILAVLTFAGLIFLLQSWSGVSMLAANIPPGFDAVLELGNALTSPEAYVLPFEIASVLLLAALIDILAGRLVEGSPE